VPRNAGCSSLFRALSSTAVRHSCATSIPASTLRLSRGPLGSTRPVYRTPHTLSGLHRELTRRAVPSRTKSASAAAVGLLVRDRAAPVPRGTLWAWETAAAPAQSSSCRRGAAKPAGPRSDGTAGSSALCLVPTRNPARAVASSHQARVCSPSAARRRHPRARCADRRHLESAYRHMNRLGNRFDLPRGRRGAPLWLWPARRALEMSIATPGWITGDPSARCASRRG